MGLRTRVRSAIHAGSLSISTGKEFFDDRRFLDLQRVKDTAGRRHLLLVMEVATRRVHKLLLSFLIDEPFQYYDDLVLNGLTFSFQKYTAQKRGLPANMLERQSNRTYRMVKHPNWGLQQPSKPTFTGKLYILINGNSFSTTSEFLSHAHARQPGDVHRRRIRRRLLRQYLGAGSSSHPTEHQAPGLRTAHDLLHGGARLQSRQSRRRTRSPGHLHHRRTVAGQG